MAAAKRLKYGLEWDLRTDSLQIELEMIRMGGSRKLKTGAVVGNGLFYHYRAAQSLCWPEDDHHRWSDLVLKRFIEEEIIVLCGSSDSGKTYGVSKFALIDWWAFPKETLWLLTSTEYRGAELRIWGCLKKLYNRAIENFPWLPGTILEGLHCITTNKIDDDHRIARSVQSGLIFVPCKKGQEHAAMSSFIGVKAKRLRHAGDESQFLKGVLDAYSNWYGKRDFKGIISGNPLDIHDGLCTAAKPEGGWSQYIDTGQTQEWRSTFFKAWVVCLDGRDSPNNDFPQDNGPRFDYLVGKKKLDGVAATHGTDSWQWYNQCIGKPNLGLVLRRVITEDLCRKHGAHDIAFWAGLDHTWIYGLDPAYGGGDRCVGMAVEFGEGLDGHQILKVYKPEIIPISLRISTPKEDQIALYVKQRLEELNIPVENCFYDSFGKGTLGFHFAEAMGGKNPRPVDFGQKPTKRPVRFDLFVEENGVKRLKRCDEQYSKFVTELWFSVRELIQSNQMRELPKEVMEEGTEREYYPVAGGKDEVEPKEDMKLRMGHSPDLFDCLAVCIEGARQRGFKIERIGKNIDVQIGRNEDYLAKESENYRHDLKKFLPTYT